jgi:acetoin utilization deacetylase AcuC-like enzyme
MPRIASTTRICWPTDASRVSRVAIIDIDVHHGNGTADIAARRQKCRRELGLETDLLFISTHEHPLYPMTGAVDDPTCTGAVRNVILEPGTSSDAWRQVYETSVLPCLADFAPDLVIISAGFDAHRSDPLANCGLKSEDFEWVTRELIQCSNGHAVSVLEGGYDIESLCESAVCHVQGLLQGRPM